MDNELSFTMFWIMLPVSLITGVIIGAGAVETNVKPEQFDKAKKSCVEIEWVSPFDFKCKTIDREGREGSK